MNNKRNRQSFKYKEAVKKMILNDGILQNKMKVALSSKNISSIERMIDRDSQSLMYVHVVDIVSSRLHLPISELYEKIEA